MFYAVGSWAYDPFTNWLQSSAKQEAQDAANFVSNKVKDKVKGSNNKVNLVQFKDKNGNKPNNKSMKTIFKWKTCCFFEFRWYNR